MHHLDRARALVRELLGGARAGWVRAGGSLRAGRRTLVEAGREWPRHRPDEGRPEHDPPVGAPAPAPANRHAPTPPPAGPGREGEDEPGEYVSLAELLDEDAPG